MSVFDRIFGPFVDAAPVDPEVPCYRDVPAGYVEIKESYRKRAARKVGPEILGPQHLFHCSRCHGWIPGWSSESEENVLNLEALAGRSGSVYYCRRCHARAISNAVCCKKHTKIRIVGCKLLKQDGKSLNTFGHGSIFYPVDKWIDVPGNGAYVSITGGLQYGGSGPLLVYLECKNSIVGLEFPGVECFRQVRRLSDAVPDEIELSLRTEIACCAPGLDAGQRMALAKNLLEPQRGEVACSAPGLSLKQRLELTEGLPASWCGMIACFAPGLYSEQRVEMVNKAVPEWNGDVARMSRGLSPEQRMSLARKTTLERRGMVAYHCRIIDLNVDQRMELAKTSTPYWCGRVAFDGPGLNPEQRMELAEVASPVYRDAIVKKWGSKVEEGFNA